jgi:hypothetical protein
MHIYGDTNDYVYKSMLESHRYAYNDSYNNSVKYIWKLRMDNDMCFSNYGCNAILDVFLEDHEINDYQNFSVNATYWNDTIGWHMHIIEWYNYSQWETDDDDGIGEIFDTGTCPEGGCQDNPEWQQFWHFTEDYEASNWSMNPIENAERELAIFIIDSELYPRSTVTGWLGISPSVSNWYGKYIPLDYDNWGMQYNYPFTDTPPVYNVIDWTDAPHEMYYPNVTDHRKPGDNKNLIMPCYPGSYQPATAHAFNLADTGTDNILCRYSHSYSPGIIGDTATQHSQIEALEDSYPDVDYVYTTGLDMIQQVMEFDDVTPPIITTVKEGDIVNISSNEELWNPPVMALKSDSANNWEAYTICNLTEVNSTLWQCNLSGTNTVRMRAAGLDTSYNAGFANLFVSEVNLTYPLQTNVINVSYPENITVNFTVEYIGDFLTSGVNVVNITINSSVCTLQGDATYAGDDIWQQNCSIPDLSLSGLYNLTIWANHSSTGPLTDTEIDAISLVIPDLNFSIWNSTAWVDHSTLDIEFACFATQTECEPTNQDAGSSQSIYQICNNGTGTASFINLLINETCTNIDLLCDDDYTYSGAITLNETDQQIHGSLNVDACIDISCWADYNNPSSGCYFDVNATIG